MRYAFTAIINNTTIIIAAESDSVVTAQKYAWAKLKRLGRELFRFNGKVYARPIETLTEEEKRLCEQLHAVLGEPVPNLNNLTIEGKFAAFWEAAC